MLQAFFFLMKTIIVGTILESFGCTLQFATTKPTMFLIWSRATSLLVGSKKFDYFYINSKF